MEQNQLGIMSFASDDRAMNSAFAWARQQAMDYIYPNAPVGPCYEATLPGRNAFCMRDVSHQALGAHVLNALDCNRTIFHNIAKNIRCEREFCSFWEICFDGTPCPVDYADNAHFWYNLPSNFDVMMACMRLFNWTGDTGYILDKDMEYFHRMSVENYILCWDRDHDGIVDRKVEDGVRGIASYDESPRNAGYVIAADCLCAQYQAIMVRAKMLKMQGKNQLAAENEKEAERILHLFLTEWWNEEEGHFYSCKMKDGSFSNEYIGMDAFFPFFCCLPIPEEMAKKQLQYILDNDDKHNQEERSYLPELLWEYGADEAAKAYFLRMAEPDYKRREYPEVSFAAMGSLASGYMGVKPDAMHHTLLTRSALMEETGFAQVNYLPLWGGYINLCHEGRHASTLENCTGQDFTWTADFGGRKQEIFVPAGATIQLTRGKD